MKHIDFQFTHLPPVTKRGREVLVALFTPQMKTVFLSRKEMYPAGIYRLFGGGIEKSEDPDNAAKREIEEETGLQIQIEHLKQIENFEFNLTEKSTQQKVIFRIYVYAYFLQSQVIINPQDDVNESKEFDQSDLEDLITRYAQLSEELTPNTKGGSFRWSDYGKIFGPIHQQVLSFWSTT